MFKNALKCHLGVDCKTLCIIARATEHWRKTGIPQQIKSKESGSNYADKVCPEVKASTIAIKAVYYNRQQYLNNWIPKYRECASAVRRKNAVPQISYCLLRVWGVVCTAEQDSCVPATPEKCTSQVISQDIMFIFRVLWTMAEQMATTSLKYCIQRKLLPLTPHLDGNLPLCCFNTVSTTVLFFPNTSPTI